MASSSVSCLSMKLMALLFLPDVQAAAVLVAKHRVVVLTVEVVEEVEMKNSLGFLPL